MIDKAAVLRVQLPRLLATDGCQLTYVAVFEHDLTHSGDDGGHWWSARRTAEALGVWPRTVQKARAWLLANGFVHKVLKGGGKGISTRWAIANVAQETAKQLALRLWQVRSRWQARRAERRPTPPLAAEDRIVDEGPTELVVEVLPNGRPRAVRRPVLEFVTTIVTNRGPLS